jgi:hypothetical protein
VLRLDRSVSPAKTVQSLVPSLCKTPNRRLGNGLNRSVVEERPPKTGVDPPPNPFFLLEPLSSLRFFHLFLFLSFLPRKKRMDYDKIRVNVKVCLNFMTNSRGKNEERAVKLVFAPQNVDIKSKYNSFFVLVLKQMWFCIQ